MSAEQEVDSNVDESVVNEAKEMGWVPKEEFRGDVSKWVDATTFVDHGRHVMPILRKNNERLLSDQQALRQKVDKLSQELEAAREDFSTLEEFHNEEITRRVAETRRDLLTKIKAAKQENDIDSEVELTDQLTQLTAASRSDDTEDAVKPNGKDTNATVYDQSFVDWTSKNPWFNNNMKRTYQALAVSAEIREDLPELSGYAFYTEVDKRLAGGSKQPARSKVEGSRGGSTQSSGNGRTYADLPAEAKAQCDKYAKRFVKANGQFKTESDYRKHFIQQLESTGYFE